MLKYYFSLFFIVLSSQFVSSQELQSSTYPQNYFIRPLELPPIIAGNFGELRTNHFHSGLDLKTNQREGYPVYASADGYISRIRVQIGGGGNALYINHPNGYTTVYMHLKSYNDRISQSLKSYQYRVQRFDVDFPLLSVEIPVKKGEIIAWSGNTGSSGGPHLHFEIRDSKTEEPINPQLFGITIPDRVKPSITGLYLYQLNGNPFSEHTPKQYYPVSGSSGNYQLNTIINTNGESGLGIACIDRNSASQNTNGPYSIELKIDGKTIHASIWERFSFSNSRGLNSHIDYPAMILTGRRIQKSFIEPGNPLNIYRNVINKGLINLSDREVHDGQYIVKDIAGNESVLNFKLRNNPSSFKTETEVEGRKFAFNTVNEFETDDFSIRIPLNTLYSDLNFVYKSSPKPAGAYSAVHHIHNRLIPLNGSYTVALKADDNLPPALRTKALLVNSKKIAQGGVYENGFVKAELRAFDSYYITVDTVAPKIVPVNISDQKNIGNASRIQFRISDNLSGVDSFNALLDGYWVLMEYEPKTGSLWHTLDDKLAAGKHNFQLMLTDKRNNTNIFQAVFYND